MRIGLDVRYISHGVTGGVRTYVYYLARELPRCAPDHDFYYYADEKAPFELSELPGNVVLRKLPWYGGSSSVWNDVLLGQWMERDSVELVHAPGNYGPRVTVPLVVTLHDALNLFPMSQHLRGFGRRPRQVALMMYLGRKTRSSLARTSHVITVSEHARRDIAERSGFPIDRITAIHEAPGDEFATTPGEAVLGELRQRFNLHDRVVLADGIKNPAAVLDAHSRLPESLKRSTQIVFFSRESLPRPPVAEALARREVTFIPRPSTADLVGLMSLATIFAFPSWFEGFGLPLVEAMSCGTPIVASSRASIPEIVGDAGLIFDLERPEQFAAHLARILMNDEVHGELQRNARRRSKDFTWQRAACETLRVYQKVALRLGRTA